jgi:hypothetical protein
LTEVEGVEENRATLLDIRKNLQALGNIDLLV